MTSASTGNEGGCDAVDLSPNLSHDEEGLAFLIAQFKDKPRIESVLSSLMQQVQDIEDPFFELLLQRFLADITIGEQLDGIGQIVGQPRAGLSDDDYRAYLRARILINLSDGQAEELIAILATMIPGSDVEIAEKPPAELIVRLLPFLVISPTIPNSAMQTARAASVRLVFEYILRSVADIHSFGDPADYPETDASRGFDDAQLINTTGGFYAGALDEHAPRTP